MRKVILFLSLILGIGVKAQIVGGYIPKNSSQTFTSGGARITGTLTVVGTSSLNGAVTSPATISGGSLTTAGTLSVGSTATVTGAFHAASTMSLGSANLTGGNTGTVAVLSDAVFNVHFESFNFSPLDATTYYMGGTAGYLWYTGGAALMRERLPYNCTLIGWTWTTINNGANGTSETATVSIRANNSTDYLLSNTITFSASAEFTASGLSQDYSAGDMINIKIVTPTWATNPTALYNGLTLWFVRRS